MKLFSNLFKEFIPAYVEIRGRETVLLEGYSRIEEYSDLEILLSSENDRVLIKGSNLELCHLSSDRIAIKGRVDGVEFI